jgi:hypothetical protein
LTAAVVVDPVSMRTAGAGEESASGPLIVHGSETVNESASEKDYSYGGDICCDLHYEKGTKTVAACVGYGYGYGFDCG